jgi:hypothetical protein
VVLSTEDLKTLKEWRSSSNKRRWERAVALLDLYKGCAIASLCRKLDRSPQTIKRWHRIFVTAGLPVVALVSKKPDNPERLAAIAEKKARLVKIIHESPSLHDVNRTTWTLETLSAAYQKIQMETV